MQRWFRRSLALVSSMLVFAALADAALAKHKPSHPGGGSSAAVAQYVEQLPTSSGSQAVGVGKVESKPLPRKIKQRLVAQAGADAPLLEQVATSSAFGAPQERLSTRPKGAREGGRPGPGRSSELIGTENLGDDTSATQALDAAVSVVTDGSDTRLIGLVVFLAAITAAALASAAYRGRVGGHS